MIKLSHCAPPDKLTQEFILERTSMYKDNNSLRVWGEDFLRKHLLEMSSEKCCYCEAKVSEEAKYMEVEHFYCRKLYPDKVLEWQNLLPSCKRCNIEKGALDVSISPSIVNPTKEDPRTHLTLQSNYRLKGKSPKGVNTITELYLNDSTRLVSVRFRIGNKICETLEELKSKADECPDFSKSRRVKNQVSRGIRALLMEAQFNKSFAATAATIIMRNSDFAELQKLLKDHSLWDEDMEGLYQGAIQCALL